MPRGPFGDVRPAVLEDSLRCGKRGSETPATILLMFQTLLIANRGEIACRILRTARVMGLSTVAVYSDADANAAHVILADRAVCIGPPPARDSYLRAEAILAAARATGAQAIHPGYGFLSENADFAEACADAGLIFVGPPPAAIRAMGLKDRAKALMEKSGVPVVPGYHGADQSNAMLQSAADKIGYPALIKAAAGGGGKGMRLGRARRRIRRRAGKCQARSQIGLCQQFRLDREICPTAAAHRSAGLCGYAWPYGASSWNATAHCSAGTKR